MKKSFTAVLAIASIYMFSMSSCSSSNNASDRTEIPANGIGMIVTPNSYEAVPEMVKLTIVNNTDTEIQYGADYTIERKQNGDWAEMPFSSPLAFIDIMYIQPTGETREYNINLYPDLTQYTTGNYRVRKNVNTGNNNQVITAEFQIR